MRKAQKISPAPLVAFIVLWIASFGLWYWAFDNSEKATKRKKQSDQKLKRTLNKIKGTKDLYAKISNLVGYHIPLEEGGNLQSSVQAIMYKLDTVCDPKNAFDGKKAFKIQLPDQKVEEGKLFQDEYVKQLIKLEDLWKEYEKRVETLKKSVKEKTDDLTSAKEKYDKFIKNKTDDLQSRYDKIRSKRNEVEEFRRTKTEELKEAESQRAVARKEKIDEKARVAKLNRDIRDQKSKYKQELENLEQRIIELQAEAAGKTGLDKILEETKRETKGQESADGEVIHVNNRLKIAYIDIGRAEGVLPGLEFQVFKYVKGGEKKIKGSVEVKKVQNGMSLVGILSVKDDLDPLVRGDKIINPVYDRNKIKYFVVAGKLAQKYSLEQAKRLVSRLGGRVEAQITAKTDFVVLGEGFEKDPLYQRSVDLGIETMLESDFVKYLGN